MSVTAGGRNSEVSPKTVDYRIQQCLKILRVKLKDYLPLLTMLLVVNE